jgi:hypothetical protein
LEEATLLVVLCQTVVGGISRGDGQRARHSETEKGVTGRHKGGVRAGTDLYIWRRLVPILGHYGRDPILGIGLIE